MPDITYDVGRASFVMKGAWNLATAYNKLDAVSYNGSFYIAKQNVPGGTAITNTTYWQLAAEKGDKGDTGGVDSVNGQQGDVWFPDSRQLISDGYTTDTEPFLMKGNGSDSDRFELAKKLGNTVAVNQLWGSANGTITSNGITITYDKSTNELTVVVSDSPTGHAQLLISTAPASIIPGRKYIIASDKPIENGMQFYASGMAGLTGNNPAKNQFVIESGVNSNSTLRFYVAQTTTPGTYKYKLQWRDLTLWYGSTDRIPSDLLAHPENWGDYYAGPLAYNAGTLESADGTVLTSFGTDGVTVLAEVDTGSEVLRGVEGSRDEKMPSGAITHNRAVTDLGTLNWAKGTGSNGYFYAELSGMKQQTGAAQLFSGISGKYVATLSRTNADWNSTTSEDKVIGTRHTTNYVCIVDSAFASYSGAQVATALSGVMLEYPLATPTTEQGTAFDPLVVTVKNGVLSWTNTKGIPVGQESHWFENLRKRVEDRLPDPPSADGTYRLTCTISGGVKTYSWEA